MTTDARLIPTVHVSSHAINDLVGLSEHILVEGWDFPDWKHGDFLHQSAPKGALRSLVDDLESSLDTDGFFVVPLRVLIDRYTDDIAATAVTLLLSAFGKPMRVFLDGPSHWRKVDVDLSRPPNRSRGVGFLPLHMDFVNAENPPDLVCLLCIRHDPAGGGKSLVAQLDDIERILSTRYLNILRAPIFNDGLVNRLGGIGRDINPFAVITPTSWWKYRFTGNLLDSVTDADTLDAVREMAQIMSSRAVALDLRRGDLLVVNQHRALHGRLPLGNGQAEIPSQERRLMLHSFVRTT